MSEIASSSLTVSSKELDTILIKDISDIFAKANGDSIEFEIYYKTYTKDSLTLDIFGFQDDIIINKIVCELFNNKYLKLPARTTLLFHRDPIDGQDNSSIVALKRKAK